ncbi:ATP-dependent DNA helicase DDM1, partial [Mucuna pruriens]
MKLKKCEATSENVANDSTGSVFSRNLGTNTPLIDQHLPPHGQVSVNDLTLYIETRGNRQVLIVNIGRKRGKVTIFRGPFILPTSLKFNSFIPFSPCSPVLSSPFPLSGFEMETKNKVKNEDPSVESPTSVLEDEDVCDLKEEVKLEEEAIADVKDDGSFLISKTMAEEEEKLHEARIKEEEAQCEEALDLNDTQFNKLDELLTQTKLYSEFLLEKMDDITLTTGEQENGEEQESNPSAKKKGRGSKRKAASQYNTRKAKRAVAAMLTRSKESEGTEDTNMSEEERVEKEQKELMPLLTGGKLKSYQLKGVKWLISLWQNGLNGILADQMGLGKTIQTIGFLSHLKAKGLDGPYMIIAPLSTLSNWVNEISRFAPSLSAIIYHGDKKQRDEIRRKHMPTRTIGPKFPIVITSYEVALNDAKKYFRSYDWKYLVVDEGHRLKNSKCKLVKALKYINVENKLLLTGTPLQNNLAELWSLLNFILPDIFASLEEFESWFNLSGKCNNSATKEELEEKRRAQVVAKLHAILRPFLLRRMKSDVEIMLPRKKEIIIYANMTEHQKTLQDHLVNKTLGNYLQENLSIGHAAGKIHNLVIQLRKVCNHPDLLESAFNDLYPPVNEIVEQCGKFHLLDRLLQRLFARKHKVLIFSQWTKVLDIMDYYFSEKGFEVCRIDGNVRLDERKRQIEDFNDANSNCRVFLLSTRAGGLGINLTAADTCILYDSDWNPQMDLQAMDRCHRIGQTKPVHVYRLSTAQSVEGRMLKRAFSKLKLEHVVIEKGQFHQERSKSVSMDEMEEEDVLALFRDEETAEDKMIQTEISDEDLERILDRSDLMVNNSNDDNVRAPESGFPLKGPGWEVVIPTATGGMLSTLNS